MRYLKANCEKAEDRSAKVSKRHTTLPPEVTDNQGSYIAPLCRRSYPCRKWKSASFGCIDSWVIPHPCSCSHGSTETRVTNYKMISNPCVLFGSKCPFLKF
ncbi:hypothetical protein QTP86_015452 [Hemibagrus guttatus]|nr:hypothetical protein QTP86_015452 [Hemibagrus guttatus]